MIPIPWPLNLLLQFHVRANVSKVFEAIKKLIYSHIWKIAKVVLFSMCLQQTDIWLSDNTLHFCTDSITSMMISRSVYLIVGFENYILETRLRKEISIYQFQEIRIASQLVLHKFLLCGSTVSGRSIKLGLLGGVSWNYSFESSLKYLWYLRF